MDYLSLKTSGWLSKTTKLLWILFNLLVMLYSIPNAVRHDSKLLRRGNTETYYEYAFSFLGMKNK